eukprot:TRINITY_DN424_c1_g1_i12.p1 TRINITY_DN424_c1_g1~~TRINITY_DN424_c1_g1_i12.p1  ORF type:complete len:142 (-),score=7.82 TRINITY_DN424_c1_g1_i12:247-672(-)
MPPLELKFDFSRGEKQRSSSSKYVVVVVAAALGPCSKTTGMAMVLHGAKHSKLGICAANLEHRGGHQRSFGETCKCETLTSKSHIIKPVNRQQPRFLNRTRKVGMGSPPSVQSRVDNVINWVKKLQSKTPISNLAVEPNQG